MDQNQTTQPVNTNQQNGQQIQPFTDQHNGVYNTLRNQIMQYASAGVPGMEDVVNALNKTHTKLMSNYQPSQPIQQARPQIANPIQTPQALQQVKSLMDQIRQRNISPTPYHATPSSAASY